MLLVTRTLDMNLTVTFNHPTVLYFPNTIKKQRPCLSQTLRQTARGCSAMRAAALGVGGCCRQWPWLLKYNFYEIFHRKERKGRKVNATTSLRSLRPLR